MAWLRKWLGGSKPAPAPRRPGPGDEPSDRPPYERSEMPVLVDGQIGDGSRGVEGVNPEGSVDISNPEYWRIEDGARRTGYPVPRNVET